MAKHHLGSWHTTLNNHASTRPKIYGGPLVPSVSQCKTFEHIAPGSASAATPSSASAAWRCSLDLPNSFTPTDGRRLQTEGYATTKDEASELACRRAVALLLMMEPSQVVLRPAHWQISPSALLEGLPFTHTAHEALPVHVAPRSLQAGVEAGRLLVLLRPHFCPPWPCRGRCRVLHEDGWPCSYPCDLPKNHAFGCMCVMHSPPEVDPVCMPCHACARPCQCT